MHEKGQASGREEQHVLKSPRTEEDRLRELQAWHGREVQARRLEKRAGGGGQIGKGLCASLMSGSSVHCSIY